ncbi:hypothetical protein [Gordonia sp. NPDC003950]
MKEYELSEADSAALSDAIFAPWGVNRMDIRQYGSVEKALAKLGPEPEWDRAVFVVNVRGGSSVGMHARIRTGVGRSGWHGPRHSEPPVTLEIAEAIGASIMTTDRMTVIIAADRATGGIHAYTSTGPEASFWNEATLSVDRAEIGKLFGERVDGAAAEGDSIPEADRSDWRAVLPEDRQLTGTLVRIEGVARDERGAVVILPSGTTTGDEQRYFAADDAPRVTGDLAIVAEGDDSATRVRVRTDLLRVRRPRPPVRAGVFTQNLAGRWRLVRVQETEVDFDETADDEAWLDGRPDPSATTRNALGPVEVGLRIELTIRPDGSFYELTDGRIESSIRFYDDGNDHSLGSMFARAPGQP